jgi:hypothetical protein
VISSWVTWLLAIYGVCTILIQFMRRFNKYYSNLEILRVQLLLYNSESSIEGVIRSLINLSHLEGRPLHLMVYDYGSTDSTKDILETLQKVNPFLFEQIHVGSTGKYHIHFVTVEEVSSAPMTIDLRQGLIGEEIPVM